MKIKPHSDACAIKRGDVLFDIYGKMKVMAVADNYCMVRRPYCYPFIITVQEAIVRLNAMEKIKGR